MKQERRQDGRRNRVARLKKPDGLSEARDFSHGFFTKWLTDKNNNQSQWKTLTYFTDTVTEDYSAALELYFLDGNINALKYLKGWTYSELMHVIKFGEYETFMEILKCDFLTDDELKSLVLYLTDNQMIEAMAYLVEYMKKNKNTDFSL